MVTQYIEVLQSYGNLHKIEALQYIEAFQCIRVTIGLQHFNILGYYRIATLQYIANHLFLIDILTSVSNSTK